MRSVVKENKKTNAVKIYSRSEHTVSRKQISGNALRVLYKLNKAGYETYLVGGCVRDLLLGLEPKDFDVATSASPEQVKQTFRNCRLIGRRFRLAHVFFGREIIEVATFRSSEKGDDKEQKVHEDGRLLRDNVFGSLEDDVWRRDFTVNSLYYDVRDFTVVDYAGGMEDHAAGILRLIGDPVTRYREDPVRMLRAVRFAVKLGFMLEPKTKTPIYELATLLQGIPAARLYDEALKMFLSGKGVQAFEMLRHYGLFAQLFPQTDACLAKEENNFPRLFIARALLNSDRRIEEGKSVMPYFLFSALLWDAVQAEAEAKINEGENEAFAFQNAASQVLSAQVKVLSIPKRVSQSMREVWLLQTRFKNRIGVRPYKLLAHPRFRAAYDFFVLRAETGGADKKVAEWWETFQTASEAEKKKMSRPPRARKPKKKKKPVSRDPQND